MRCPNKMGVLPLGTAPAVAAPSSIYIYIAVRISGHGVLLVNVEKVAAVPPADSAVSSPNIAIDLE